MADELLTGRVRVRRTLFGRCVLQVEVAGPASLDTLQPVLRWRDARIDDLSKEQSLWPLHFGMPIMNAGSSHHG